MDAPVSTVPAPNIILKTGTRMVSQREGILWFLRILTTAPQNPSWISSLSKSTLSSETSWSGM